MIVAAYVLLGGLFAVMWTDTVQGFIMIVGLGILLAIVWSQLGGPIHANEALAALGPTITAPNGLTSVSPFGSPFVHDRQLTYLRGRYRRPRSTAARRTVHDS